MKISEAFSPARAIPQGWGAVQRAPIPVLVGAALLMLSDLQCGMQTDYDDLSALDIGALLGLFIVFGSFFSILRFLLGVFLRPGYLRMGAANLRGESPSFESIFSGGDRFWDMLLWKLLRLGVLVGTGFVLCVPIIPFGVLGGVAGANDAESIGILFAVGIGFYLLLVAIPAFIYVETGLYFGPYLVVLERQGAMTALRTSWKETSGHRLWLLLYRVLMSIFSGIGVFFFLIGGVVTWGITELGTLRAFLDWRAGTFTDPPTAALPIPPGPVTATPATSGAPPTPVTPPAPPAPAVPVVPPAAPIAPAPPEPPTDPSGPENVIESGETQVGGTEPPSVGPSSPSGPGSTSN